MQNRRKHLGLGTAVMLALSWSTGLCAADTKPAATKQILSNQAPAKPSKAGSVQAGQAPAPSVRSTGVDQRQSIQDPEKPGRADIVRITADRLVAETKSQFADFIGSVHAVQGDTTITCDKLRVFYQPQKTGDQAGHGAVKRLEAEGNVVIHYQEKVAVAPKAVYEMATGVVVLSGTGARVTEGPNTISGETITLFRNQERMVVEKGGDKRVEAIFFPGDKSSD